MKKYNSQGFTLIEFIIVIVLMGIIGVMASKVMVGGFNAFLTSQNVTDADWQGQLAMERMSRDIRAIRSAADITTYTSNNLEFIDINGNSIEYRLSSGNLLRNTQVLANGINSLTFGYRDKNGGTISSPANGMYIVITLNITQKNTNYSLTTSVYLRNLSS